MSKIPTHAKTIELEDKERKRKLSKLLYHTDDMMEILGDIVTDYIKQVSLMKDEELGYDRSHWIVYYGDGNGSFDENTYDVDIHTITILIEQVRRFGRIFYDKKKKSVRLD